MRMFKQNSCDFLPALMLFCARQSQLLSLHLSVKVVDQIFHTSGSVIELPATYEDFCDFREEWCGLMSNCRH